jgi:hypothetical protein
MRCAIVFLLLLAGIGFARDRPIPAVVYELSDLVQGHAEGKANFASDRQRVVIAHDAMTFFVHQPDRLGRLQKAQSEHGPNRDGVVLEVEYSDRPYGGPMALPQWFRGPYYFTHCSELKVDDRYLFIRARFGEGFPADIRSRILEKVGAKRDAPHPVRVHLWPKAEQERFKAGEPILVTATLSNGLNRTIRFVNRARRPVATNAETRNIELADIRRDGKPAPRLRARPELKLVPGSGPGPLRIPPRGESGIGLDLSKWQIAGGWVPGSYELSIRMFDIAVDDRVTLSVLSSPVRFVIE